MRLKTVILLIIVMVCVVLTACGDTNWFQYDCGADANGVNRQGISYLNYGTDEKELVFSVEHKQKGKWKTVESHSIKAYPRGQFVIAGTPSQGITVKGTSVADGNGGIYTPEKITFRPFRTDGTVITNSKCTKIGHDAIVIYRAESRIPIRLLEGNIAENARNGDYALMVNRKEK